MEAVTYRLDRFEGPLDLLLTLIQKNKVSITDIPIALICDQYLEYIEEAQALDMEIASEFIVVASELMLLKSKTLLPKVDDGEENEKMPLTDVLLLFGQAKEAAAKLTPLYAYYSARMVKDTDEISVDKSFVHDQDVMSLCEAVRRIVAYNNNLRKAQSTAFAPMISKPIIPVEIKIVSIIRRLEARGATSLAELLDSEATLPDIIASFLGVLELIKTRKLVISESDGDAENAILSSKTKFIINENTDEIDEAELFANAPSMAETDGI